MKLLYSTCFTLVSLGLTEGQGTPCAYSGHPSHVATINGGTSCGEVLVSYRDGPIELHEHAPAHNPCGKIYDFFRETHETEWKSDNWDIETRKEPSNFRQNFRTTYKMKKNPAGKKVLLAEVTCRYVHFRDFPDNLPQSRGKWHSEAYTSPLKMKCRQKIDPANTRCVEWKWEVQEPKLLPNCKIPEYVAPETPDDINIIVHTADQQMAHWDTFESYGFGKEYNLFQQEVTDDATFDLDFESDCNQKYNGKCGNKYTNSHCCKYDVIEGACWEKERKCCPRTPVFDQNVDHGVV